MMLRWALPLLAAVAALRPAAVQAETYIKVVANPGDPTVPGTQQGLGAWGLPNYGGQPYFGQTFIPPADPNTALKAFTFYINELTGTGSPDYQALVLEYNTTSTIAADPPVFTGPVTALPPLNPPGGDYKAVTTTLPQPVTLDPLKTYILALKLITQSNVNYNFAAATSDVYADGITIINSNLNQAGTTWTPFVKDLAFWAAFGPPIPPCDPTGITLTGKTSPKSVRVGSSNAAKAATHGPTVRYTVTFANTNGSLKNKNKTAAAAAVPFGPAGLVVQLPANTNYVKARVSPRPTVAGTGNKKNTTLATPVYDAQAHTVTWPDAPLAARRKRKYTVWAKVLPTATSPLVFQAACPNCPQLATQNSVTVTRK